MFTTNSTSKFFLFNIILSLKDISFLPVLNVCQCCAFVIFSNLIRVFFSNERISGWSNKNPAYRISFILLLLFYRISDTVNIIAIYSNKILVNFEIRAAKYLGIQATSKIQITTKNVNFTIPAIVYKGCIHCRDYKSMYLSAITADYVFLTSLVIDCREYRYIYVVTKI